MQYGTRQGQLNGLSMKRAVILFLVAIGAIASQPHAHAQTPASGASKPYLVNPGDEVEVYVWGEERLQRTLRVLPDGSFAFPLVGRIEAAGKQTVEIEALIAKGLQSQYRGQVPQVTVSVRAASGMQFSVAGRVKSAGTFTPGRYVNVVEALALAGGPDEFANLDNILILRKTPTGLQPIRARLAGLFKGNVAGRNGMADVPAIESGDTVLVP